MDYQDKYRQWCESEYFDRATREELLALEGNEEEIQDRFYRNLSFGTGGLRGVIGAGENRMNVYTVRRATQGLANYIIKQGTAERGVAIAYDSRRKSAEFANAAALCLAANGIRAYVFDRLRPTPELSFAVRELNCTAGIVITASHNPPEYNGYKVYWEDGAQITSPRDMDIINEVNSISDYDQVREMSKEEAIADRLYNIIGNEIDEKYMTELKKQILRPEIIRAVADNIKIVYTPLNGTGNVPVRKILKEIGFRNVFVVPEQEMPDPDFSTVEYPNPEDPKAFTLALQLARQKDADIILATDPDADRLGIYVKDTATGEYIPFTGNMSGMIIAEYILREKRSLALLPSNGALVKTIVTTNLAKPLCRAYGVNLIEVLTGFKYIGEQIRLFEENNAYQYIFGLEESYGCLVGTHARDKDAVVAAMSLCEVAAWCKYNGITLWDHMKKIYSMYGYYKEGMHTVTLKGMDGAAQIDKIMSDLRSARPHKFAGKRVLKVRDYLTGQVADMVTGNIDSTNLPVSNVLYYELENDYWCCVRPSGTEPKIKFYMGVKADSLESADVALEEFKASVIETIEGNC